MCVQGLGFVGAAMAVAVAQARTPEGIAAYQVVGVDLPTPDGHARVDALNEGVFPFPTSDKKMVTALTEAHEVENLRATTDSSVFQSADVAIVDIPLDIDFLDDDPQLEMSSLEKAIRTIGRQIPKGSLIIVETTVPPGTCKKFVLPVLEEELRKRNLDNNVVHLAVSFERVMPGAHYLDSIINFWRVYAGHTESAADACQAFLQSIVDVQRFPLTRLSSITAVETAKVMENTYRAANIAFVDEWTKYAEAVGLDLYEIIDAIRVRPTHSNIRTPGLGVGGYCLTKDPAFTPAVAKQVFGLNELEFPFSKLALKVNSNMPRHSVNRLVNLLEGSCIGKSILVLGLSYRQDIGDTRYSPVEVLVRDLESLGAQVTVYDPYLDYWPEMDRPLPIKIPDADGADAVVIATPHHEFKILNFPKWLSNTRTVVLDTANVVSADERMICRNSGIRIESIGRGDGL